MTSKALRRRLHHGDLNEKRRDFYEDSSLEGLIEPLLGNSDYGESHSEGRTLEDIWNEERKNEHLHWTLIFSQLIAQWAQWIANIVLGSGSLIGRFLPLTSASQNRPNKRLHPLTLSPLQEERLRNLQQRLEVPFDGSRVEHQSFKVIETGKFIVKLSSRQHDWEDALKQLWRLAYPNRELPSLKSELWKDMGWQGEDPSTDFRGGGFISLENLIFFARKYPESFQRLLHKQDGSRAEWEYPFAVAGINISFMLAQMLDLHSGKPSSLAGIRFLDIFGEDEMAFDNLYCVAFQMMDAQWLAKRASYMDFNDVLKSTRTQLERELELEDVTNVRELPAFNLLR